MMQENTTAILNEVKKVIEGKDEVVEKIFMAVLAQGHVLLEDVPGVGKTTMALAFAKVLGLECKRITFTVDTMPSDVTGFSVYEKESGALSYHPGPVMTNLLLGDEINRTSSRTQAALLEAMEEKQVTIDGMTYPLPEPFVVIATENPVGSAGTQYLPESQLDRFMIKEHMGYPDFESQIRILKERHSSNPLDKIACMTDAAGLTAMQKECEQVEVADAIYEYVTRLVEATRTMEEITLGISPRGALALCRMSKAHAYVSGRDYVIPKDVFEVFSDVCAHRIRLSAKAKMTEVTAESCLKEILAQTELPKIMQ